MKLPMTPLQIGLYSTIHYGNLSRDKDEPFFFSE